MKHYTTFVSSPLVHINMIDNIMSDRMSNLDKRGSNEAARLFWLAAMFPSIPAGILLAVATRADIVRLDRKDDVIELYVDEAYLKGLKQ